MPYRPAELAAILRPFLLGDMAQVAASAASQSAWDARYLRRYRIRLYDPTGPTVIDFEPTSAGLADAIAAASSGDTILLPPGIYSGNVTVPDGVELVGFGYLTELTGAITNNGTITDCNFSGTLTNNGRVRFSATSAVDFLLQGTGSVIPTNPLGYPFMAAIGSPHGTIPWGIMQDGADSQTPSLIHFETSDGDLGEIGTGYRNSTGAIVLMAFAGKRVHLIANGIHKRYDIPHLAIDTTGRVGIYKDVPIGQIDVQSAAAAVQAIIARGASGQEADIYEALTSAGVEVWAVTPTGAMKVAEQATPSTPSTGYGLFYFKADGKAYSLNDAGEEVELGGTSVEKASDLDTLWTPLTDGNIASPELVFSDGDVVMVEETI
jgi:hypothetical protein